MIIPFKKENFCFGGEFFKKRDQSCAFCHFRHLYICFFMCHREIVKYFQSAIVLISSELAWTPRKYLNAISFRELPWYQYSSAICNIHTLRTFWSKKDLFKRNHQALPENWNNQNAKNERKSVFIRFSGHDAKEQCCQLDFGPVLNFRFLSPRSGFKEEKARIHSLKSAFNLF